VLPTFHAGNKRHGVYRPIGDGRKLRVQKNPYICGQLMFDKGGKTSQWGRIVFNKWYWDNWISTCNRMNLNPYLTLCIKSNSKGT